MRIINMRTMPKFSISVNGLPQHRYITNYPEHRGGKFIDGGRTVETDLNASCVYSRLSCWMAFWVRKTYYRFTETYDHEFLGYVDVLRTIEIAPPKWVCRLFKWNTNI